MRIIKLVGALITVLALTSIAAATATAAETLWPWLPGTTGEDFINGSGNATLTIKGGGSLECTKSKSTGVITAEQTLGLATIDFEGCKAEKIAAPDSLGDAKEIVLVHAELHNCVISPGHAGILIKLLPLHLEVPLVAELMLLEGSFIAEVTPDKKAAKKFELIIKQTGGVPAIEKCEGGSAETLTSETNENGKKVQAAAGVQGGFIEFLKEQEAMA